MANDAALDKLQTYLESLREKLENSITAVHLNSVDDVINYFRIREDHQAKDHLYIKIKDLLINKNSSDFDTHDLRVLAGGFTLDRAVNQTNHNYDEIIYAILPCLEAGSGLKKPNDDAWDEVATIGRALVILDVYRPLDLRQTAVAFAASRLMGRGFKLEISNGKISKDSSGIQDATAAILDRLAGMGVVNVLRIFFSKLRKLEVYEFDQYLLGRRYKLEMDPSAPCATTFPYGFFLNLAVRLPDCEVFSRQPESDWREANEIACDLAAVIDVEPYNQFWAINLHSKRLLNLLAEIGLYDHLFSFRQWSIFITPLLLRSFFGTNNDTVLIEKQGWGVEDAAKLCEALIITAKTDPALATKRDLQSTGLSAQKLNKMLVDFAHKNDVNIDYTSPLNAKQADFMFKPLLIGINNKYIVPAASIIGPAFYEVIANAMRKTLDADTMAQVTGDGTEKAISTLLRFRGLVPSFESAEYDGGECDIILEDQKNILFIECKGKAVTRGTMSGEYEAAFVDYAEGVFASHVQALRHERLLVENGSIKFNNGKELLLNGRRITRLCMTLLDHGSMQDKFLLLNLVEAALQLTVRKDSKKRFAKIGEMLDKHRQEMEWARGRGEEPWVKALGVASLSFGQLAIILVEASNLSDLISVIRKPTSCVTMNPLLEYLYLRQIT